MGENRKDALRVDFDKKLKLEFHGTKVYTPTHCQDKKQTFLRWIHHRVLKQLGRREPEGATGVPTATSYTSAGVR